MGICASEIRLPQGSAQHAQAADKQRILGAKRAFLGDAKDVFRCHQRNRRIAEDRIIVPENARDFRRLIGGCKLHPGLIVLPVLDREGTWTALQAALAFLEGGNRPVDVMVNHVLEIDESGRMTLLPLTG